MADHVCHHPRCDVPVPPKMMACKPHWFQLPKQLRDAVWSAYVPGQETRKDPSAEYMDVYQQCQEYWAFMAQRRLAKELRARLAGERPTDA